MSGRRIRSTIRTHADEPDPNPGLPDEELREALSSWASGVAVLAVSDGEEIDAITLSAFSAVSLDPPLVLVCVNEQASTLPMLLDERRFVINVLAEDQQRTASAVAQRLPGSLAGFRSCGDPILDGALAAFVCTLRHEYPGGTHRILVAEVERVEFQRAARPLLYFRRRYEAIRGDGAH